MSICIRRISSKPAPKKPLNNINTASRRRRSPKPKSNSVHGDNEPYFSVFSLNLARPLHWSPSRLQVSHTWQVSSPPLCCEQTARASFISEVDDGLTSKQLISKLITRTYLRFGLAALFCWSAAMVVRLFLPPRTCLSSHFQMWGAEKRKRVEGEDLHCKGKKVKPDFFSPVVRFVYTLSLSSLARTRMCICFPHFSFGFEFCVASSKLQAFLLKRRYRSCSYTSEVYFCIHLTTQTYG